MRRSTTLCIAACWLIAASPSAIGASAAARREPAAESRACLACHPAAKAVLSSAMALRAGERAFARRAFGTAEGDRFFENSCSGCHVSSCSDCHGGGDTHPSGRPGNEVCLRCHRGYSAGWEYEGKAPREDHIRYQRGATSQGMPFLEMLPDVHFEAGMTCADCHPMSSLHIGGRAKACLDCHPSPAASIPEHDIAGHMTGMRCASCHSAWATQEYGTFLIRTETDAQKTAFAALQDWGEWRKTAHLRKQDAPPLGLDLGGRVAPMRPRFILFVTDNSRGWENHLAAAEWRVVTPHTIRRGSVACGGCHDNPRRFLLEPPQDRIYALEKDGLSLASYWSRPGHSVINGSFIPRDRYERMNARTPEFARQVVRQWQRLLNQDARPSGH